MTDPQQQNLNHDRATAVIAVADLLRQPPGELRELAILSIMNHVRGSVDLDFTQIYLAAMALNEKLAGEPVPLPGMGVGPLMSECQEILTTFYPQFRDGPLVGQMVALMRTMNSTGPREITASDVFGVQASAQGD